MMFICTKMCVRACVYMCVSVCDSAHMQSSFYNIVILYIIEYFSLLFSMYMN